MPAQLSAGMAPPIKRVVQQKNVSCAGRVVGALGARDAKASFFRSAGIGLE